jgi:hypothetical protein
VTEQTLINLAIQVPANRADPCKPGAGAALVRVSLCAEDWSVVIDLERFRLDASVRSGAGVGFSSSTIGAGSRSTEQKIITAVTKMRRAFMGHSSTAGGGPNVIVMVTSLAH